MGRRLSAFRQLLMHNAAPRVASLLLDRNKRTPHDVTSKRPNVQPINNEFLRSFRLRQPFASEHNHVLLACFPKSGSTFLANIISSLPNFHLVFLASEGERREQELCFEQAARFHNNCYVAQQHVRYSGATQRFMDVFNLRAVFLVRNIFDALVSLDDHIFRESGVGPVFHLPLDYKSWPEVRRYEFLVSMAVPWYINLFMSWEDCPYALRLTYDKLIENTFLTVRGVCDFADITVSDTEIKNAIAAASQSDTRQNVGINGRGERIPVSLRQKIYDITAYYPNVNFSSIL